MYYSESKLLAKILQYVKDAELRNKLSSLSPEEIKVMEYFIQNISVGTILALKELKTLYRIEDPKSVIRKLIEKGLIEQGRGCYSLAKSLREALLSMFLNRT